MRLRWKSRVGDFIAVSKSWGSGREWVAKIRIGLAEDEASMPQTITLSSPTGVLEANESSVSGKFESRMDRELISLWPCLSWLYLSYSDWRFPGCFKFLKKLQFRMKFKFQLPKYWFSLQSNPVGFRSLKRWKNRQSIDIWPYFCNTDCHEKEKHLPTYVQITSDKWSIAFL